jgi:MoxR-like ATPase
MEIRDHSFEVFDRQNFVYRTSEEGSEKVKEDYVSAWNQWKEIVETALKDSGSQNLSLENTEHWQNSGNLRRRFWSRIKDSNQLEKPSCIAAMISKDNLRVYLEWHGYKNEKLYEEREIHNSWVLSLAEWIQVQDIDQSEYKIWTNIDIDEGFSTYSTLEEFLSDGSVKGRLIAVVKDNPKNWIRIGKVYPKTYVLTHEDFTKEMGQTINELEWLYKKSTGNSIQDDFTYKSDKNPKHWLFNVFYSQNPVVWEESKQMSVAAMQYENGKETASSVTKQLNIIKAISVGDYIVAYTGAKGFLGYGRVIKEFYEEENKDKFINASGGTWRQRVGVNWIKDLDSPIKYTGSKFMQDVGVKGNTGMNTATIFEISEDGFQFVKNLIENKPAEEVIEPPEILLSIKELIDHIHSYISSKGFHYSREEVINLFLSIKTKPFVILSGISGTGKTKIVQWFAESVGATEENGQFKLIPVRPDWNDSSDILGYVDIKDDFKLGPLTKVIEEAEKNPYLPYFVLLDEMNLARVEHYFSDILSVMESRKWQGEEIVTSTLLTAETAKRDIKLPTNLYIIGTVNMDETTHPFSKKVLDRANTIEFNRVELTNLSFLEEKEEVQPIAVSDSKFRANYLHLKDLYRSNKALVEKVTKELEALNKSLKLINAHVGYRVRDEICFYLDYNENSNLMDFKVAFDHCILQKILPRISGSDKRVERLLGELYTLFTGREYIEKLDSYEDELKQATYKKSAAKVLEMLRRLRDDGFTSFWVS